MASVLFLISGFAKLREYRCFFVLCGPEDRSQRAPLFSHGMCDTAHIMELSRFHGISHFIIFRGTCGNLSRENATESIIIFLSVAFFIRHVPRNSDLYHFPWNPWEPLRGECHGIYHYLLFRGFFIRHVPRNSDLYHFPWNPWELL